MDDDDFEGWTICWEVNKRFQVQRKHSTSYDCVCVGCNRRTQTWSSKYRSEFPSLAVQCFEGHLKWMKGTEADICGRCNQDFTLKVSSRSQRCAIDGCRRLLIVDEDVVRKRLESNAELLKKYMNFLDSKKVFECSFCKEMIPLSEAPPLGATKCNHDPSLCSTDLNSILEEAINRGRLAEIKCPDIQCRATISPRDVRKHVSADTFRKFNERITLESISRDPNFRWCRGTINGRPCMNGQFHPHGAEIPQWICKRHLEAEDEETMSLVRKMSKVCPKRGCGRRMMRSAGCAHMTCWVIAGSGCETEFCWSCKMIFRNKKPSHAQSCCWRAGPPAAMPCPSDPLYAPGWSDDPGYDTEYDYGLWMPDDQM
ncbi:hypothetical protein BGZ60DRAFT_532960 [Tricladium varicosporioides]|nr:hypothetical protein BGZ60DRAFT_532960 [Hymenoscyphus varicosporioides]